MMPTRSFVGLVQTSVQIMSAYPSSSDACEETGHCMGRFALLGIGSTQNLHV